MKSPLLAALVTLQLATLGLVVGLLLKRNGSDANPEIERLTQAVQGALNQERIIIQYLDQMRREAAATAAGGNPPAGIAAAPAGPTATPPEGGAPSGPATAAQLTGNPNDGGDSSPFPAAAAAIAELKRIHQSLRDERKSDSQNEGPIKLELERRKSALIAQGHGAVYVVRKEVDLQPYERGRDALFVVYLLDQVVPALSSAAKDEAFDIARGALVRQTNEAPLKLAAAKALQAIDSERWVKDVCDVIALGKSTESELRGQLLALFIDAPRPQAVELCKRFMDDATAPIELRDRAIAVLEKQNSSAVNPALRRVVFDETAPTLKLRAFDALWGRLKEDGERRKLAQDVLDENPARMPDSVQQRAKKAIEAMDAAPAKAPGSK
jgi:hypothetical protein